MKDSVRHFWLAVFLILGIGMLTIVFKPSVLKEKEVQAQGAQVTIGHAVVENYYSPAVDLENIDVQLLNQATNSVYMSEYALTDEKIADQLVKLANRHVNLYIYRDLRQYDGEVAKTNNQMVKFKGNPYIHIKVKHSSVLAHLKAYVVDYGLEGQVLREGSANWSESGEQKQDNSLIIIRDKAAIETFYKNYQQIWNRFDNTVIQ
jgi:phosphatidylserine/phosphatidylglycerophosphate/cardiolipin synthase-like enzyme